MQRDVQFFQGRPSAAPGDFQTYYIAGLVARQPDDNRLYSYREISDPNNAGEKIIVNPQLDSANPDSAYGRAAKSLSTDPNKDSAAVTQYLYPPFFSLLISPLTFLSFKNAVQIWYFLSFLFIGMSVFLTVKMFDKNLLTAILTAGLITFFAEFIFPMQDLLWAGNVGAAILFLYTAAIYLQKNNYPALSALLIAVAVFIKLTPLILIPLMIIRRQWKWLAAFAGWSVLLLAISFWQLGWQNHREFLTKIMPAMSAGIAERNNRTLLSLFQFIELRKIPTIENIGSEDAALRANSTILFKIPAALALLGTLYYFRRDNKTASQLISEMYALVLLSLIVSPISWRHSYILALAPLIFIWLHPLARKWSTAELALLTAATVGVFSVLPDYGLSVSNSFLFQMLMVSIMPGGVLISLFLLFKIQRKFDGLLHIEFDTQTKNADILILNGS